MRRQACIFATLQQALAQQSVSAIATPFKTWLASGRFRLTAGTFVRGVNGLDAVLGLKAAAAIRQHEGVARPHPTVRLNRSGLVNHLGVIH